MGGVPMGGDHPVVVKTMTKTDTRDVAATLRQVHEVAELGCDVIRIAAPDKEAAEALAPIVKASPIPVVADIHFDHRLALVALESGVHGLRLNPGNIQDPKKVREVALRAKERGVRYIRIGVNAGSLPKDLKATMTIPEAMVAAAEREIAWLREADFEDICVSLKSSNVLDTVKANREFARRNELPLHLGVTEAGLIREGTVKSSIGLGVLLLEGIGDAIRVSLTSDPHEEVKVGWEMLAALDLRRRGVEIIACPTCGRLEIDLFAVAQQVKDRTQHIREPVVISVMGCVVNGPGEADLADVGLAGGRGVGVLYDQGEVVRRVSQEEMVGELVRLAEKEAAAMRERAARGEPLRRRVVSARDWVIPEGETREEGLTKLQQLKADAARTI